jgi:uncharacterized membrane protein YdjX (TVP38/TMEM64 family)
MTQTAETKSGKINGTRWLVLAGFFVVCVLVYFLFRNYLDWETLVRREQELRLFTVKRTFVAVVAAWCFYFVVAATSVPGTWIVSMFYGWLFGFLPAVLIVILAATAGATMNFWLSRYLFRAWVEQHIARRWPNFDTAFESGGGYYLLTMRLIPGIPFIVVNSLMGLTKMPTREYWWITLFGMLPGTCAFVWAGASAPRLQELSERGISSVLTWQLMLSLTVLGLLPLVLRRILTKPKKQSTV